MDGGGSSDAREDRRANGPFHVPDCRPAAGDHCGGLPDEQLRWDECRVSSSRSGASVVPEVEMETKPSDHRAGTGAGVGLAIGAAMGMPLALLLDWNIALGIGLGVALGLVVGAAYDANQARKSK